MSYEELERKINMLKLNMNEKQYDSYLIEEERKKNIYKIVITKNNSNSITRLWIEDAKKYISKELRNDWEFDCYYYLSGEYITEEAIKAISYLIISLSEENDKKELLKIIRNAFFNLSSKDEITFINYFLKKYAKHQEILEQYIYNPIEKQTSKKLDAKKEFDRFYKHIYPYVKKKKKSSSSK